MQKKMRILLVAIRSGYFPVGLAYISSAMKSAGYSVDCCTLSAPEDLRNRLQNQYDFIATGGLSSQFAALKQISDIAREFGTKIIMGGGIITSEPEIMSRALQVDYAVLGEGEIAVVDLLRCLENKGNVAMVEGIGYFAGKDFVLTSPRKQIEDLDALPLPDFDGFDFRSIIDAAKSSDQYYYNIFDYPREYPIITSRSCPFLCTFCYHPSGDTYRKRSIDSIMKELQEVIPKYRINIVSIYDELFSYSEERAYEFCQRFKEFAATLPWQVKWCCQMRVSGLKEDMLDAMRDSGCYMVSYGFESYSPVVLKSMKKGTTPEQIHHAIHATLDRKIAIQGNFIFGDRSETFQTARETLDFWKDHPEAGILLTFILACPNSALYQYCIEKGIIKDKLDFIKGHLYETLNMTALSQADFFKLQTLVLKYMVRYSPYANITHKAQDSLTIRCPYCNAISEYKNSVTQRNIFARMRYCRTCRKRVFAVTRLHKIFLIMVGLIITPFTYKLYLKRREFRLWRKKFYQKINVSKTRLFVP